MFSIWSYYSSLTFETLFSVLELEKKKETAHINSRTKEQQKVDTQMEESENDDDDDDDIDEYLDWRAKKAHKWMK